MSTQNQDCFTIEIDNFSKREGTESSEPFISGGFEWYLKVRLADDHLSLYLYVANRKSLQIGWKRSARFYFVLLNESNKELYRSTMEDASRLFCAKSPSWGYRKAVPLSKFEEEGVLENDRLIVEVYIETDEAGNGEGGDLSESEEIVDINGFRVFVSQATSVKKIFEEHPEFTKDFKLKNKVVKTEYMNVLLKLIKTLEKPRISLSETKLSKARSNLTELMNAGFKIDWLKSKLEEDCLERKKASEPELDMSRVQQLEERIKNLELSCSKMDSLKSKLEEVSLERKKADWSRVQKLEESVKNFELTHVSKQCLNARLQNVYVEIKKPYDSVAPQVTQLGKSVKNLELMVSNLTAELDKKEAKSSVDDFLLVDNVD